jgi:nitrogen-specific signal transduction histidine kinase
MNIGTTNINSNHLPPSLIPRVDRAHHDHHTHNHSVQFYEDGDFLLDQTSQYIGSALGAGGSAIVIATKAHREGLERRLKALGFNLPLAARQGRYVALDAAETLSSFMLDGRPDAARFAELVGGVVGRAISVARGEPPRVAAFGEMVALLWAEGKTEAALQLEQLWNDLALTYTFDLHCGYPISYFSTATDDDLVRSICSTHSHVIPAESYTTLAGEDERFRAITVLQQKAQALESEIEERKKAEASLQRAVEVRDEFLSVAAHELKTPVTVLRGFAQLLLMDIERKRDPNPLRLQSALAAIEIQTEKLSQLVTRLLDTAQIEAAKLKVEPVQTDLVALVQAVLDQQQGSPNHILVYDGPDCLRAQVDPIRFEQVITNLLDNAVKFSPKGGIVTVSLEQLPCEVRVCVTDQGVGIPVEQREAIFGLFQQAHGERHLSGLGLGLYIAREIVELHGGTIRVEEPEHVGSRFVVTLPTSIVDN